MSKKIISLILCMCLFVSLSAINVFAADASVTLVKTISGIISLPAGETAPNGGVAVTLYALSDNGTPYDRQDDFEVNTYVVIPEGQSQTNYSLTVPESKSGYTLYYYPNGYAIGRYSEGNSYLVDLSNGDKTDANITLATKKIISGVVSLPNGETAPVGGLNVYIEMLSDNGTPENWQDDIHGGIDALIPEGQNQAAYALDALEAASGYKIIFSAQGYVTTFFTQNGGTTNYNLAALVDVNDGSKNNINVTLIKGRTISGTVHLPDGEIAPNGGVGISISVNSDNGTQDDWQDDLEAHTYAVIPEGQSQAYYSVTAPQSNSGYTLYYYSNGYISGPYHEGSNYLIDLSNGDKNDANITLARMQSGNILNISASNGKVIRSLDKDLYDNGESVTLTAVPDSGYRFTGWSGDVGGSNPTINVVMDGNKNITAMFTLVTPDIIEKIEIPKNQKKLMIMSGTQVKIDLKVVYIDGSSENLQTADWKSTDENVATVENGLITAIGIGKAKVTASYMGKKAHVEVDTRLKHK